MVRGFLFNQFIDLFQELVIFTSQPGISIFNNEMVLSYGIGNNALKYFWHRIRIEYVRTYLISIFYGTI